MLNIVRILVPLFVSFGILVTTGCAPVSLVFDKPTTLPLSPTPQQPVRPVAPSLPAQADSAWRMGDMAKAEKLYSAVRKIPDLDEGQMDTVFFRLNQAALANSHVDTALEALRAWSIVRPDVTREAQWIGAWAETVVRLPKGAAMALARNVGADVIAPPALRGAAMGVQLVRGDTEARSVAADSLGTLYVTAERQQKAVMERCLLKQTAFLSDKDLADLLQNSSVETDKSFPWSVLLLEKARREVQAGEQATEGGTLERIKGPGVFAAPEFPQEALKKKAASAPAAGFVPVASPVPLHPSITALAVPLTGQYAGYGKRIAIGAEAARAELNRTGVATELIVIDTNDPQWTAKIDALPAACVMVGGPLGPQAYAQAKSAGLLSRRVFFTFLPKLDGGDEGRKAWRFFTAPQDQVRTLMEYASAAGVSTVATLYPDEAYGRRMNAMFHAGAAGAGGRVVREAAYPPNDMSRWNDVTRKLLRSWMQGKVPVSGADFGAVYIPDSWKKAELLIPYLFYHGEDRLLIMGSSLWERGATRGRVDIGNLRTAVFPAAWNPDTQSPVARNLAAQLGGQAKAGFWTGLGYDFIRFASAMQGGPLNGAGDVNSRLSTASQIIWSMAPLSWTSSGVASQKLFVLNPSRGKAVHVPPDAMAKRLEDARQRYASRVHSASAKDSGKKGGSR